MYPKTLITAPLLVGASLTIAAEALASPESGRVLMEPPSQVHDPVDHAAPSASERLAERGGSTLRVGSDDTTCDFDSLSAALSVANNGDTILLEDNDDLYLGDSYGLVNQGLTIRGGYDDCTDTSPSGRTTLNADGNERVFDFWLPTSATDEMNVVLENLTITGGVATSGLGGAGIVIEGRQGLLAVELKNVEISNNEVTADANGGGIHVIINGDAESNARLLEIDNDSIIEGNSTAGNGGGLACTNAGSFDNDMTAIRIGAIEIAGNSATNGGGLAFEDCRNVFIYGGGPVALIVPTGAIFGNSASQNGGGLYVTGSSVVSIRGDQTGSLGDLEHAAHIVFNDAELGGGAYVDGLALNMDDVVINGNEASEDGGGVYADSSLVRHRRLQDAPCEPSESSGGITSVPRCSRMTGNTAAIGAGGGYFVTNGASLDVDRTIITGNDSDLAGSVVRATADDDTNPGVANFRDVLVHGNTGSTLFYG